MKQSLFYFLSFLVNCSAFFFETTSKGEESKESTIISSSHRSLYDHAAISSTDVAEALYDALYTTAEASAATDYSEASDGSYSTPASSLYVSPQDMSLISYYKDVEGRMDSTISSEKDNMTAGSTTESHEKTPYSLETVTGGYPGSTSNYSRLFTLLTRAKGEVEQVKVVTPTEETPTHYYDAVLQRTLQWLNDTYTLSILVPICGGFVVASFIIVSIATCRCLRRRCCRRRLRRKVLPDSVKNMRQSDRARLLAESTDEEF